MGFRAKRQRYQDEQNDANWPTFFISMFALLVLMSVFFLTRKLIGG